MRSQIRRLLIDDTGATSIEYALIASLVSMGIIGWATFIGADVRTTFQAVAAGLAP